MEMFLDRPIASSESSRRRTLRTPHASNAALIERGEKTWAITPSPNSRRSEDPREIQPAFAPMRKSPITIEIRTKLIQRIVEATVLRIDPIFARGEGRRVISWRWELRGRSIKVPSEGSGKLDSSLTSITPRLRAKP